jgi:ATP/maltotriose-dependent transcriptional regulator MalT
LPEDRVAERVRLQVNQAYALTFLGRWEEAETTAQDAAQHAADKRLLEEGSAIAVLGVAVAFLGDPVAGTRHLRRAVGLAERAGNIQDLGQIQLDLGEVLRLQGQVRSALQVMLDGERLAARHGTDGLYGNFMAVNAADDLLRLGRWDEAEAKIRELERRQLTPTAQLLMATVAGRLNAARGDFESAVKSLERGVELTRQAALLEFIPTLRAAYAELELWRNAPERAREQIAAGLESVGESTDALHLPALYAMGARTEADAAEEARLLGDIGNAERAGQAAAAHCERLAALLEATRSSVTPPEAEAHLAGSQAELSRARGASSPDRWAQVAELWRELDRPYPTAYAAYRHAEALVVAAAQRAQAQETLAEAARLASSLSAQPLLSRIRTLARAARLALGVGDSAEVPTEPAAERPAALDLTERELQVLALLAAGLTNREIAQRLYISQRTAGVHVSHILAKLGVANRVMAAAAAQRLGIPPAS